MTNAWKESTPLWMWTVQRFNAHVIAWYDRKDRKATEEAELAAVKSALEPPPAPRQPVKEIIREVLARHPGVTWLDIKHDRRARPIVEARQDVMYEIYTRRHDISYPFIGRLFGGRDHSTVIHAVRRAAERLEEAQHDQ